VRLLYERGAFGGEETTIVAHGLAAFVLGLTFNGTMLMLNRAFFSLQNAWIPTAVALGNLVLNAALDAVLFRVGIWGIPLATSFVNIVGTVALLVLLRRRLGRLQGRQTIEAYVRTALAAALAAGVAYATWYGLDDWLGRSLWAQIASVGLGVTLATAAFLGAARILRIQELDALLSLLRRSRPSV
jgi:putative peptidoglycan lipid II flippase